MSILEATPRLVVLNARPGLYRGGVAHPARAAYDLGYFSFEQLLEMHEEPAITMVIGNLVSDGEVGLVELGEIAPSVDPTTAAMGPLVDPMLAEPKRGRAKS